MLLKLEQLNEILANFSLKMRVEKGKVEFIREFKKEGNRNSTFETAKPVVVQSAYESYQIPDTHALKSNKCPFIVEFSDGYLNLQ